MRGYHIDFYTWETGKMKILKMKKLIILVCKDKHFKRTRSGTFSLSSFKQLDSFDMDILQ